MKILIFNSFYFPRMAGGAEYSCKILCEELVSKGHEVTVSCLHDGEEIITELINGVTVVRFPLLNIYWFDKAGSKLKSIFWHFIDNYNSKMKCLVNEHFATKNFDIVHTNNLKGFSVSVWDWAAERNLPVIHTLRDYYLLNPNSTLYRGQSNHSIKTTDSKVFSFLKRKISAKVTYVIGVSDYIKALHVKNGFFPNAKSKTIYNGVSKIEVSNVTNEREFYSFGYLGFLDERKGVSLLINEFEKFLACNNDSTLYLAGDGNESYVNDFKDRVHKNIIFMGKVPAKELFEKIDFLIVPSLWNEPMGRVVVEAYCCGVPVITSTSGGLPELVKHGQTGFTFEPKDEKLLNIIRQVSLITSVEYKSMKEKCYEESLRYISGDVTQRYLEVYNETLSERVAR